MQQILLVEDDLTLGEGLQSALSKKYHITWCPTFACAKEKIVSQKFDLIILDLGLPDGIGTDLLIQWPAHKIKPPVLILSAQGDAETRLQGFELGAEDFVPKPFHLKELQLRIEYIFKVHPGSQSLSELHIGSIKINFDTYAVHHITGHIEYPPVNDLKILKHLLSKSPVAVSRDELINSVWGENSETSHRTIDNSIARLRQLLGDNNEQFIRSVRGIGYSLEIKIKSETT